MNKNIVFAEPNDSSLFCYRATVDRNDSDLIVGVFRSKIELKSFLNGLIAKSYSLYNGSNIHTFTTDSGHVVVVEKFDISKHDYIKSNITLVIFSLDGSFRRDWIHVDCVDLSKAEINKNDYRDHFEALIYSSIEREVTFDNALNNEIGFDVIKT